jgi:hypothetical protein
MPRIKNKQTFQQSVTFSPATAVRIESVASAPIVKPQTHLYFVNAPVDFLVIGLGSILSFVVLFLVYRGNSILWAGELAFAMQIVINHPHFAATNYRLYHNKDNIMQYPFTALVIPWLILAAVIGSFYSPDYIAIIFYKVFMFWSPYHFSGQTLGITLIYARRAGFFVGKWERFTLSNLIYGTFLFMTARGDMITAATDLFVTVQNIDPAQYREVAQYRLGLPTWVPHVILAWMIVNGVGFLVLVGKWCGEQRRILPPIVLLPVITQIVWFIPGAFCPSFYLFVPMFHSLQYLLIAWSLQLKEKMDLRKITPSVGYVVKETARWSLINLVLGALLFMAIPYGIYSLVMKEYEPKFTYAFVLAIIGAGVQVHHFFVDGVIWKLKKKTVASPLMVNLEDLIHPQSPPQLQGG